MNITVAGTGYVGLVTAVCFAEHGFKVTCVDIDVQKVAMMSECISPIYEPNLSELMLKNKDKLFYTTNYEKAYKEADIIFVGVGTPEKKDGSANLNYVYEVCYQIKKTIEKDCIVIIKSTVPIGTNDKLEELLNENSKFHVDVVSNPEFLAQGTAVNDTLNPSRIVIGAENDKAMRIVENLYQSYNAPIVKMSRKSAEMVKYASNDFLALKISYVNEIANLCDLIGANIEDVTCGMGLDSRIGNKFLKAGIGYGGSCFPKDTKALHWLASYHDFELKTVKAAIEVNENQKIKLIKKSRKYYPNGFKGLTVAVLGLTFKPNTDDLREAPSIVNIPIFLDDGAKIQVYDPIGMDNFKKIFSDDKIKYCNSAIEAIKNADICFILTEWEEIIKLQPEDFVLNMNNPIVCDGRNCFNKDEMIKYNIQYFGIGNN